MLLHMIQDAALWLTHLNVLADLSQLLQFDLPTDHLVLAQNIRQTDLVGDVQKAFDNFVKTGQAWAFLIGLVFGYLIKTFTTFG